MKKYIAYYRVSTKKQGQSGLSIEWQEQQVNDYIQRSKGILLEAYTEVETGTRKRKRIEIHKAIAECKQHGATLIVAKLDRLSRDVEFIYSLKNAGVKFLCLDIPDATDAMIGFMAVMAESEANRIKERINNAFAAKRSAFKAKGGEVKDTFKMITNKQGKKVNRTSNFNGNEEAGVKASVKVRKALAEAKNAKAIKLICRLRNDAKYTFLSIAESLNEQEVRTARGNDFTPKQVQLLYNRYCKAA